MLLCSDGLSAMLRDETILSLVLAAPGPAEATEALVAAANASGGDDNVTVVLFEVLEGEAPERPMPPPMPPAPGEEPHAIAAPGEPAARGRRHGAGDGSRWPALLLLAAIALVAALALWWGLTR